MSNIPDSVSTFRPPHIEFGDGGASMIARGLSHFAEALGDGSRLLEETRLLDKKSKQLAKLGEYEKLLSEKGLELSSDEKLEALPLPEKLQVADRTFSALRDKFLSEMPVDNEEEREHLSGEMGRSATAGRTTFMMLENQKAKLKTSEQLAGALKGLNQQVRSGGAEFGDGLEQLSLILEGYADLLPIERLGNVGRQMGRKLFHSNQDRLVEQGEYETAKSMLEQVTAEADDGEPALFDPGEREGLHARLDQQIVEHGKQEDDLALRQLFQKLQNVQSTSDLRELKGFVDRTSGEGLIQGSIAGKLQSRIEKRYSKLLLMEEADSKLSAVLDGVEGKLNIGDPEIRKSVDRHYRKMMAELDSGASGGQMDISDPAAWLYFMTEILPASAVSEIRTRLFLGNVHEIGEALDWVETLAADGQLDQLHMLPEERSMALTLSHARKNGYLDQEEVEQARRPIMRSRSLIRDVQ